MLPNVRRPGVQPWAQLRREPWAQLRREPRINYDAETKEFERSLWRNFRICQERHTYVERRSSELYSRYVKRDNCDEEMAYKLRVLRGKCRVCYTNADREFHKAAEQIPISGNMYKAYRAAAELSEQCQELSNS